jgi:hypothetical protein
MERCAWFLRRADRNSTSTNRKKIFWLIAGKGLKQALDFRLFVPGTYVRTKKSFNRSPGQGLNIKNSLPHLTLMG